MMKSTSAFLSALLLALVSACGGGGGGGGGGVSADLLIGDAPVDDLLSFSAVVQSVRLQRDDSSFTGDLFGSLEVEFLGLNGAFAFLSKERIPAGTYVAVEIGFAPGQYEAKADDGSPVTVVASDDTYLAALPAPLTVVNGDYVRFSVDLDLAGSLSGSVGSGSVDFGPSGSCDSNDGSEDAAIDELKGSVVSSDLGLRTVVVNGSVGNPPVSIGRVTVHVGDTATLLDNDNASLSVNAFFALLSGGTLLEIHGNLGLGGLVEATRIELEDAGGGNSVARIEGVVNSVSKGAFNLQIGRIKEGEEVVQPVLDLLGNPAAIDCSFDGSTAFVFDNGGLTTSGSLAAGQEVQVRFSAFTSSPYPASEVEIDDTPGLNGILVEGGAGQWSLQLGQSSRAARALDLDGATLVLDVPGHPAVQPGELAAGLVLSLRGNHLASSEPTLRVEQALVRPGFLRGARLTHLSARGDELVVDGGEFLDSFGASVRPGPLAVRLEPGCRFQGAVNTAEELAELVRLGTPLELDLRGLGDGHRDEIRAFVIGVRVAN